MADASLTGVTSGLSGIFGKLGSKTPEKDKKSDGPVIAAVPVGRTTGSIMRLKGRGERDTILNGADGIPA